jgi:hypothetical protein
VAVVFQGDREDDPLYLGSVVGVDVVVGDEVKEAAGVGVDGH